jgi:hypothetical protein
MEEQSMNAFNLQRRQAFIDELTFKSTIRHYENQIELCDVRLSERDRRPKARREFLMGKGDDMLRILLLKYTAGAAPTELAAALGSVIAAYDTAVAVTAELSDDEYSPAFRLNSMLDIYVDYLNLVCLAILLHREDLIPTIFSWHEDTDYDGSDAILEELFDFYFPDRPLPENILWKPFIPLVDVIDEPSERSQRMAKYVKGWYKSMKGKAAFWDSHTTIEDGVTSYFGYWTLCAAAFTYLFDIDDATYRNELAYPKDLVDYARSIPRNSANTANGYAALRVLGGQRCPVDVDWFTPAQGERLFHFTAGHVLPTFDDADYGMTIWQLKENQ